MNGFYTNSSCVICEDHGNRGFYLCDDFKSIVVVCDECSLIYPNPRDISQEAAIHKTGPNRQIPGLEYGFGDGSRWATRKEIESAGYGDLIHGESEMM